MDLAIVLINKYILSYSGRAGKHYITLFGMAAVLVIFYIFLSKFNRVSDYIVNRFVHITKAYIGRDIGLYTAIIILSLLLYAGYYMAWFDRNFFSETLYHIRKFFI